MNRILSKGANVWSFSFLVLVYFFFCASDASLEIVAGHYHNCVYEPSQTGMKCWGLNTEGQLGYEDTNNRGDDAGEMSANLPIVNLNLGPNSTVNTTSLGGWHSCAASQEHKVKCWGRGNEYQTGHATSNTLGDGAGEMGVNSLVFVEFGFAPLKVAAGGYHSCALSTDALVCFGSNTYGQCGAGTFDGNIIGPPSNIANVDLGRDFTPIDISAFLDHVCAISQQQTIKCFGQNTNGQLGYGDTTTRGFTPQSMGDGLPVLSLGSNFTPKAVATGGDHTCALSTLKAVKCFGNNGNGQCGQVTPGGANGYIGDEANEMGDNLPVIVFPDGFVPMQMALGYYHTCILSESAQVVCFGANLYGQLGLGHRSTTTSPTPVDLGTDFVPRKLTAGAYHTCAVSTVDTVKCWGKNDYGQLGLGHANNKGDQANEMGDNLPIVDVAFPTVPSTSSPTTAELTLPTSTPTTPAPTTAVPTTAAPTSVAPTTAAPTTSGPTTAAPTATAPTEAEPTASPTTIAPISSTTATFDPTTQPTISDAAASTHPSTNDHTVTVTVRSDSLSSTQILVAVAKAFNVSSTPLTFTPISSSDDGDGSATVELLLVAVTSNVPLDYDVIEATLREAMVDEYGDDIEVEIGVHEKDAQPPAITDQKNASSWGFWVAVSCSSGVCACCVIAVGVYVRNKRMRDRAPGNVQAPPPPPPPVNVVPGLAIVSVLSKSASQVEVVAVDDDERKQGEADVELEMAIQENAKEKFVYDPNRNYKPEGARASIMTPAGEEKSDSEELYNNNNNNTTATTGGTAPMPSNGDEDMYVVDHAKPKNNVQTIFM